MNSMAWHGMVWYGMVWYGMVWYGMVWYGMVCIVWYGMLWYDAVLSGYITTLKNKQKLDVSSEGPSSRVSSVWYDVYSIVRWQGVCHGTGCVFIIKCCNPTILSSKPNSCSSVPP